MLPADSPFASLPAPGPHPATAELRAYAAGTLNPADEHRIEAHALDCERCAELLNGFTMSDVATTDQALAGLRTRLQARVGQPEPVAGAWAWPRIAAAAALLAAIGTGFWGWEQREAAPAATAQVETVSPAVAPGTAAAPKVSAAATVAAASETTAEPDLLQASTVSPAPGAAGKNTYAAVQPARRSPARLRAVRPSVAPSVAMERVADDEAVAAAAPQAAADAPRTEPMLASAPAAPATYDKRELPGRVAADTMHALSEVTVASRIMKAKAAPASSAALVANTPMPATVAIAPAPVAGTPALREYLRRTAAEFELEDGAKPLGGVVRLRFIVGADGKLNNLQVVRGIRADYDEEALRMICEGPAWRPGVAGGRRAALPVEITVSF